MTKPAPRILIAAGGTGGHVFPALAIADEIRAIKPEAQFLFIGTRGKIEAQIVPKSGYAFSTIWISGFHRSVRPGNLLFPLKVVVSLIQSVVHIRKFKPDVAVGTGGYVCGPVLSMASCLGVPVAVHESNSYPGVTTRILAGWATRIFTAFDATAQWLKRTDNVEHIGMPTRALLGTSTREQGAKHFGLDPQKKTVLIFGGSLGAASINVVVREQLAAEAVAGGFQLIWQTGRGETEGVPDAARAGWAGPFIDAMEHAYAAADIVVCRAGASTLAELTLLGKPAVLIPYPHAAADHQTINARTLSDHGAAVLIADSDVSKRLVPEVLRLLNDDPARVRMAKAALMMGRPNAGVEIATKILQLIRT